MPVAISMYTLSVSVHVIFVVSFLGVAGANGVLGPMLKEYPQHAVFALRAMDTIHKRYVLPAILVIWGTGIYQASDGGFDGGDVWLTISVVLFAVMTILSLFVLHPSLNVLLKEFGDEEKPPGPPSAEAMAAIKKQQILGPFMGVGLIVITFMMVAKPF